ncbi:kinase-like domain-containing protein [Hyaloraphidium curvatum]|nr:kinase-like domain-containing protein [Hyaloraphidium curvatum]
MDVREDLLIPARDLAVDFQRQLGAGAFGSVFAGRYLGTPVAVKVPRGDGAAEVLAEEIAVWGRLQHPNVLQLIGATADPPMLVVELGDGDLRSHMELRGWDRGEALRRLLDAARAMAYIHGRGFVHGDLKPANVLVCGGKAKVEGFALAAPAEREDVAGGTPLYMAPEMFDGTRGPPSDVYAFALTAYEVLGGGYRPFASMGHMQFRVMVMNGTRPTRPYGMQDADWQLITRCWAQDPAERPTFVDIIGILEQLVDDEAAMTADGAGALPGTPESHPGSFPSVSDDGR